MQKEGHDFLCAKTVEACARVCDDAAERSTQARKKLLEMRLADPLGVGDAPALLNVAKAIRSLNTKTPDSLIPISSCEGMEKALETARDLLLERIHGSPARSAAHNARLVIEDALSKYRERKA